MSQTPEQRSPRIGLARGARIAAFLGSLAVALVFIAIGALLLVGGVLESGLERMSDAPTNPSGPSTVLLGWAGVVAGTLWCVWGCSVIMRWMRRVPLLAVTLANIALTTYLTLQLSDPIHRAAVIGAAGIIGMVGVLSTVGDGRAYSSRKAGAAEPA